MSDDWETKCPATEETSLSTCGCYPDGWHCPCWYDGDGCCNCGERALTDEELVACGSEPR